MMLKSSEDCADFESFDVRRPVTAAFMEVSGVRKSWVMESGAVDKTANLAG